MRKTIFLLSLFSLIFTGAHAGAEVDFELNGLFQAWFESGEKADGTNDLDNQFELRRVRLGAVAQVTEIIDIKLQTDGYDPVNMIDAYMIMTKIPWAHVQVGKFKYDLDLEGRASSKGLAFPTRPIATRALGGLISQGPGAFRMIGFQLKGKRNFGERNVGYAMGVFNGQSTDSDEDGYAFLINLNARPFASLVLNSGFVIEKTADSMVDHVWTAGGRIQRNGLVAGGEYYMGENDSPVGSTQPSGFYVFMTKRVGHVEVGGRYQWYDQDTGAAGGAEVTSFDIKAAYYIGEGKGYRAPRLTLLYEIRNADSGYRGEGSRIFDEKGSNTFGNDVKNVLILELSVPF